MMKRAKMRRCEIWDTAVSVGCVSYHFGLNSVALQREKIAHLVMMYGEHKHLSNHSETNRR